jgi:tetratricopeptide (TPR) repeat protein
MFPDCIKRSKLFLVLPVLLFAIGSSGQTLKDATVLLKKGLTDSAIVIANKYIAADESNADAYLIMGQALMAKEKFREAAPYFLKIKSLENSPAYSRAWAMNEFGILCFATGDYAQSKENILGCITLNATENSVSSARKSALLLGFDPVYNTWITRETKHFIFHFQDTSIIRNLSLFIRNKETAFDSINNFFHAELPKKIDYFVWRDADMAGKLFNQPLAFTRAKFCLTHTDPNHTLGHEITHSISKYAVEITHTSSLISEGVAVYFDQSHRDNITPLKQYAKTKNLEISVREIWKNNSMDDEGILYPLGGELVGRLIKKSGREKFMMLLSDQSLESAEKIYGPDLDQVISELERELKL